MSSRVTLFWIEGSECGPLAVMARPRGHDWLEDEIVALRDQGISVLVSLLTTSELEELGLADEAEVCEKQGLKFLRFPLSDRGVPGSAAEVSRFLERVRDASATGGAVAIHCRMGIGRSSMIAACLLIEAGCDPRTALERVAAARGCPVPDTDEQRAWIGA
jgi:protein-tyrosine phosphatase